MNIKYFETLKKVAVAVEPVRRAKIAACLVYKNQIISIGINQKKSHPFQQRYSKNEDAIYLHAETDAIKNALREVDEKILEKSTLYVLRTKRNKKGKFINGLAKPCCGCERALAAYNIKRVYYSTDDHDTYGCL